MILTYQQSKSKPLSGIIPSSKPHQKDLETIAWEFAQAFSGEIVDPGLEAIPGSQICWCGEEIATNYDATNHPTCIHHQPIGED